MQRREFITLVGGAAGAWPLAVRAQQPSGRPLIALLSPLSAATATRNIAGLRNGLRDLGLVEGRNIFLALRFAGGHGRAHAGVGQGTHRPHRPNPGKHSCCLLERILRRAPRDITAASECSRW
jgi:hypothetical protein